MSETLTPDQKARIDCIRRVARTMRGLRRAARLSRTRLSEISGVPAGRIRAYEELVAIPSTYDLAHIAAALGCTPEQLEM